jgi:hypothetical protein
MIIKEEECECCIIKHLINKMIDTPEYDTKTYRLFIKELCPLGSYPLTGQSLLANITANELQNYILHV